LKGKVKNNTGGGGRKAKGLVKEFFKEEIDFFEEFLQLNQV